MCSKQTIKKIKQAPLAPKWLRNKWRKHLTQEEQAGCCVDFWKMNGIFIIKNIR